MALKAGMLCLIKGNPPEGVGYRYNGHIVELTKYVKTRSNIMGWLTSPPCETSHGRPIAFREACLYPIDGGDLSKEENVFSTKPISLDKVKEKA